MDAMKWSSRKVTFVNSVLFAYLLMTMLAMFVLTSSSFADEKADNSSNSTIQNIGVKNPATDLWRAVRKRNLDSSQGLFSTNQVRGAGTLINTKGSQWSKLRSQQLIPYGGYFILGVIGFLALLMVFIRKRKIPNGRSGKVIPRMSSIQRISHWLMTILVGFMAITGLLLLFGRFVVIPLVGADAFSPLASASKEGHNLFGPLVIVSLLLMLVYFIRHNLPAKGDIKWLLTAGGIFSKKHVKVGFFNAGEKFLFWATILLGVILSVTGLLLLFPYYEQTINLTQISLVIHAIAALLLIALVLGHVWMVRTVEGTLDAMITGDVDENWAKAHHSRWVEEAAEGTDSDSALEAKNKAEASAQSNHGGAY